MCFGESISKVLLITFNICFFIIGLSIFGIGIWLKVDKSNLMEMLRKINLGNNDDSFGIAKPSIFNIVAILLIVIGLFTLVAGFCGCCGAIKESKCLLYTYSFLVGSVIIAQVAIGIYAGTSKNKVKVKLQHSLIKILHKHFNGALSPNPSVFTLVITSIMFELKCCGINGESDFDVIADKWKQNSQSKPQVHPIGCCVLKESSKHIFNKKNLLNILSDPQCPYSNNVKVNTEGCFQSVIDKIEKHLKIVIGVCIGLGLFEILCIVFACVVAHNKVD